MNSGVEVLIPTEDGDMPARVFLPRGNGPHPGVIMYHHIGGLTPGLLALAARVASCGYACVVPSLYWRIGTVVIDPDNRDEDALEVRKLAADSAKRPFRVSKDTGAVLDFMRLSPLFVEGPRGVVGYCMGGRFAVLVAAAYPDEIRATVCLFGTGLLEHGAEDLWTRLSLVRGSVYFGMGEIDPRTPKAFLSEFESLLRERCTAEWAMEVHEGADHGYSFKERPAYQRNAAEASWRKMLEAFKGAR